MSEGLPGQCYSVIPAGVITYIQPQSATQATWTTTSSAFPSPYTMWAVQVNGYIVPNPAGTSTTTSSPTSSTTTSSSASGSATNTTGSSSGLSQGAKAGIGVAVALGVVGIAALLGACILFRRRQAYMVPPENATPQSHNFQHYGGVQKVTEQPAYEMSQHKHENYGAPASELEAQRPRTPELA